MAAGCGRVSGQHAIAVGGMGSTSNLLGAPRTRDRIFRYLAPLALAVLAGAVALLVLTSSHGSATRSHGRPAHAQAHRVPPYWIVHPNNTLAQISARTGLSVAQLEAYNPNADPNALTPGERLNLWRHPPKPRPKPPGPMFWTVKPGDSFGSIAAATQINMFTLQRLNRKLASRTLQPGDRVRLRR